MPRKKIHKNPRRTPKVGAEEELAKTTCFILKIDVPELRWQVDFEHAVVRARITDSDLLVTVYPEERSVQVEHTRPGAGGLAIGDSTVRGESGKGWSTAINRALGQARRALLHSTGRAATTLRAMKSNPPDYP